MSDMMGVMDAVAAAADQSRIEALLESQRRLIDALEEQTILMQASLDRLIPLVSGALQALSSPQRVQVLMETPDVNVDVAPAEVSVPTPSVTIAPIPPRTRTVTPIRDDTTGRITSLTIQES